MATKVRNTTTGEVIELEVIDDGIDFLCDVLGGCDCKNDGDAWLLDDEEVRWWSRWCERETRINEAYGRADDATRAAYFDAVSEYCYDMETLQDELERVLGIDD